MNKALLFRIFLFDVVFAGALLVAAWACAPPPAMSTESCSANKDAYDDGDGGTTCCAHGNEAVGVGKSRHLTECCPYDWKYDEDDGCYDPDAPTRAVRATTEQQPRVRPAIKKTLNAQACEASADLVEASANASEVTVIAKVPDEVRTAPQQMFLVRSAGEASGLVASWFPSSASTVRVFKFSEPSATTVSVHLVWGDKCSNEAVVSLNGGAAR